MNSVTSFLNKNIKMSGNYGSILQNRFVLYFFCFLAIVDVLYFATTNDIQSFITILIVGFLTSFFNKNMIIVLFMAITITHVLRFGTSVSEGMSVREGMKETIDAGLKVAADEASAKKDKDEPILEKEPSQKEKKAKIDTDALKDSLKTDFKEFQSIQQDIIDGLQKIDPLLSRVEKFVEKYENYKAAGVTGTASK
uniref:Uncharacterized protein n=1 Tax=viral metagenome TaxID=1070528 RepID=A0A6C0JK62_9ZZZZ